MFEVNPSYESGVPAKNLMRNIITYVENRSECHPTARHIAFWILPLWFSWFFCFLFLVTEIFLIRPVSLKTGQGRDNENHLRYTENQKLSRYSETLRSVRYTENLITSKYTEILNFERCIGKLTLIVYPLIFETVYWSFRTFRKIDFDCLTVFLLYSVW